MKPFKGSYKKTMSFREPYPEDVLDQFPVLKKWPYNGKAPGDEWAVKKNVPIIPIVPSNITYVGTDQYGGKYLVARPLSHPKVRHFYVHFSKITCKKGQKVVWYRQLGLPGKTGMATGVHILVYGKDEKGNFISLKRWLKKMPPDPCQKEKKEIKVLEKKLAEEKKAHIWFRDERVPEILGKKEEAEEKAKELDTINQNLISRNQELEGYVATIEADARLGESIRLVWSAIKNVLEHGVVRLQASIRRGGEKE